ncbi:MAG: helix-turn-helix transcriptional regulator [Alphaproteobacteria bacterium]|nr:helix-turn-helix transcriptional regulator [Alphaproteobacteria bacterium]
MPPEAWDELTPPNLAGMRCMMLPVHRDNEPKLLTGCVGHAADTSPPVRAALHTCAHVVYDRIRALDDLRVESVLTKREAECLYWASKGKTDAETGEILGIAQRTVRFHIGNAKQKLNAETRIQAITKKATR